MHITCIVYLHKHTCVINHTKKITFAESKIQNA